MSKPIADYAIVSDCHSAALVSSDGSVDWLCFPRFDAPSVFGRILDEDAGHWCIAPVGSYKASRRYLDRTLILETTFESPSATVVLQDLMALGRNERGHELGGWLPARAPPPCIVHAGVSGGRRRVRAASRVRHGPSRVHAD